MSETQKPFACAREGCKMAFTNEDHLTVHKKKHDMALHLGIDNQSNAAVADQTPTPTRFIRNCEEVGLFQDLQNVNPFDETFRKATELAKSGTLHIPEASTDDTLHTPHIFPHIEQDNNLNKFSRNNSNEPEFTVTTIDDALLKLSGKDDLTETLQRNSDSSDKNDTQVEVASLTDASSNSEHLERSDFVTRNETVINDNGCSLITKDSLISNTALNTVPVSIPLVKSDLPSIIVNNLSDIEININKNDMIHEKTHSESKESTKRKGTIKSKLKEAIKNKFRIEENESDDQDIIQIENTLVRPTINSQLMKSLEKRVVNEHSTGDATEIKLSNSRNYNVTGILFQDGPQDKTLCKSGVLLTKTRLERQREINRAAQVRSRERKKYWINQMETEIALLKEEKKELWLENQTLKNEIVWLKTMLLYHKDCPVAKDPQTMEEINMIVRTSQEEIQKQIQKNLPAKKVVPIRPNPPNIIALTSVPNPVLVQVPTPIDSTKGAIQITTLPTLKTEPHTSPKASTSNNTSSVITTMSTLMPCSVVPPVQNISTQNSQNIQISPIARSNIIIGIVNHSDSSINNNDNTKLTRTQPRILKAKDRLKRDRRINKKLQHLKINPANITHLSNTVSRDGFFIVKKPTEIQIIKK